MADSIEIMGSGDHGNVAYDRTTFTHKMVGYDAGRILLEDQRKGDAIDVGDYAQLRLLLVVEAMNNRHGAQCETGTILHVTLEHSPDQKAWSDLVEFEAGLHFRGEAPVAGFHRYIRASWWFVRPGLPEETIRDEVTVAWSLTAEALPETE